MPRSTDRSPPFTSTPTSLTNVSHSRALWGDYDADGNLDVFIMGLNGAGAVAEIFRNDSGSYVNIGAPLIPSRSGGAGWADYDGDGDLDLASTGTFDGNHFTRIYRNDAGEFADIGASLAPTFFGDVDWDFG